ncbi:MAG: glycosyltransferase family 2 protein [Chitinophagales bacterium]
MNISLIIFCYNESGNIRNVINNALKIIPSISSSYEILVVNDGSVDGTADIIDGLSESHESIKTIHHSKNLGIGMALLSGYKAAQKEYICAIPGDGQFDLEELREVKPFTNNTYYSFYRPKTNYNLYRRILTWLNRLYNQHILGIYLRDVNWIKIYRKDQIDTVDPKLKSSLVESEICARLFKKGILPIEIPSKYLDREYGDAKGGSFNILIKVIPETIELFWAIHFR